MQALKWAVAIAVSVLWANGASAELLHCEDPSASIYLSLKNQPRLIPMASVADEARYRKFPSIFEYLPLSGSGATPRNLHQNHAGTKVGFWLGGNSNIAFLSPQVKDLVRKLGSDVVVLRPLESSTLSYRIDGRIIQKDIPLEQIARSLKTYTRVVPDDPASGRLILGYGFGNKITQGTIHSENQFSGFCVNGVAGLDGMPQNCGTSKATITSNLLIRDSRGVPIRGSDDSASAEFYKLFFGDFSLLAFRQKILGSLIKSLDEARPERSGKSPWLDGFAYDLTIADPRNEPRLQVMMPKGTLNDPDFFCGYNLGLRGMLNTLSLSKKQNGLGAFTIINVLEHRSVNFLRASNRRGAAFSEKDFRDSQEKLMQRAHGGIIEYFGGFVPESNIECDSSRYDKATDFCKKPFADILDQLRRFRLNPEKYYMAFGRGPKTYVDYSREYRWQEYLYGVYLLGSGPNTSFKYLSAFQTPTYNGLGRHDGLSVFYNQTVELGTPRSWMRPVPGTPLWIRVFDNALVVVNPHDSGKSVSTNQPLIQSILRNYSVKKFVNHMLPPEKALFIPLKANVDFEPQPAGRLIDFTDPATRFAFTEGNHFLGSSLVPGGGIKLAAMEPNYLHDILLSSVAYPSHLGGLWIDFKKGNSSTLPKFIAVAEVDDAEENDLDGEGKKRKHRFVTFLLSDSAVRTYESNQPRPLFMAPSQTSAKAERIPQVSIPYTILSRGADGRVSIAVNIGQEFSLMNKYFKTRSGTGTRFRFVRWHILRPLGEMELLRIRIGETKGNLKEGVNGI